MSCKSYVVTRAWTPCGAQTSPAEVNRKARRKASEETNWRREAQDPANEFESLHSSVLIRLPRPIPTLDPGVGSQSLDRAANAGAAAGRVRGSRVFCGQAGSSDNQIGTPECARDTASERPEAPVGRVRFWPSAGRGGSRRVQRAERVSLVAAFRTWTCRRACRV